VSRQIRRRTMSQLPPDVQQRIERYRQEMAQELPDLADQHELLKEAAAEPTLSGELRRAVHACDLPLPQIAQQAGMPLPLLGEFLTGERTLRSDVMDRLATAVELVTVPATDGDSEG